MSIYGYEPSPVIRPVTARPFDQRLWINLVRSHPQRHYDHCTRKTESEIEHVYPIQRLPADSPSVNS